MKIKKILKFSKGTLYKKLDVNFNVSSLSPKTYWSVLNNFLEKTSCQDLIAMEQECKKPRQITFTDLVNSAANKMPNKRDANFVISQAKQKICTDKARRWSNKE